MVFRGAELEYDNVELLRGQSHVIKVTQRSETAVNITISCNTTLYNVGRPLFVCACIVGTLVCVHHAGCLYDD